MAVPGGCWSPAKGAAHGALFRVESPPPRDEAEGRRERERGEREKEKEET
jgi:hypothetical protein